MSPPDSWIFDLVAQRNLLPSIPHIQPPGTGILFKKSNIDEWLERYRREPIDLDAVIAQVFGKLSGKEQHNA